MRKIQVIDSHTGGEPTRVVVDCDLELGDGKMAERLKRLHDDHDDFRRAVVNEPRGWDAMVGALPCEPAHPDNTAGVIFFNNVGYLGMCVHGMIGLVATLAYQNRITPGEHRIETPVGEVQVTLQPDDHVLVTNVASYRTASDIRVTLNGFGDVVGDVAWGGNWFFLVNQWLDCDPPELSLANVDELTYRAWAVRHALVKHNVTGLRGEEIDHIELYGPPTLAGADSKNFVLCPGKAYDRSPCGTGTSAKVACLHADGKLVPGETWRQESIVGSVFEATFEVHPDEPLSVIPTIGGSAYFTSEATLLIDPNDPFRHGTQS